MSGFNMSSWMKNPIILRLGKSTTWAIATVFFGLFQVSLILATTLAETRDLSIVARQFEQLLLDGALLFFSTTVVASLTIDRLLRTSHFNFIVFLVFIFIPFIIISISVWIFGISYGKEIETISNDLFQSIKDVEYGVFAISLIYAFVVKFFAFKNTGECK